MRLTEIAVELHVVSLVDNGGQDDVMVLEKADGGVEDTRSFQLSVVARVGQEVELLHERANREGPEKQACDVIGHVAHVIEPDESNEGGSEGPQNLHDELKLRVLGRVGGVVVDVKVPEIAVHFARVDEEFVRFFELTTGYYPQQ